MSIPNSYDTSCPHSIGCMRVLTPHKLLRDNLENDPHIYIAIWGGDHSTPVYAEHGNRRARSAEPVRSQERGETNYPYTCQPRVSGKEVLATDLQRQASKMIRARSCEDATRSHPSFPTAHGLGGTRARSNGQERTSTVLDGGSSSSS